MKTIDTVIPDIYHLLETKEIPPEVSLEAQCEAFGKAMGDLLLENLQPERDRSGSLRLSSIGKPDRKIWNAFMGVEQLPIDGPTYIKFLYGHIVEALVLSLAQIAGHSVTDQQKEVTVEGVKGHMDGRIDGTLMDVKSCSAYGFKKFERNTLHLSDDFGYIAQLKGYAQDQQDTEYAWLAMCKQTGKLALLKYDENDTTAPYAKAINYDIKKRVRDIKKLVSSDLLPVVCHDPVPDGKSGNERLATGCAYCDFKYTCWPEVQKYDYAAGPKYLTVVNREPKLKSYPEGF